MPAVLQLFYFMARALLHARVQTHAPSPPLLHDPGTGQIDHAKMEHLYVHCAVSPMCTVQGCAISQNCECASPYTIRILPRRVHPTSMHIVKTVSLLHRRVVPIAQNWLGVIHRSFARPPPPQPPPWLALAHPRPPHPHSPSPPPPFRPTLGPSTLCPPSLLPCLLDLPSPSHRSPLTHSRTSLAPCTHLPSQLRKKSSFCFPSTIVRELLR